MPSGPSRTVLHALLVERAMTYSIFEREYVRVSALLYEETGDRVFRNATVAEPTLRRWTSGGLRRLPAHPTPAVLERMFGLPVARLLANPESDKVHRAALPALTESDIEMTAREAAGHASEAAASTLPEMTIDQLEDDIRHLAAGYSALALPDVYQRARLLLEVSQRSLEQTQSPRQRARLYLLAGEATALCAAACFDLFLLRPAAQFARTAFLYGQTIEFGPLQAYAQGVLAYISYWQDRPAEAVRHAQAAAQAQGVGTVGRRRIAVIAGRAWGHLGDAASARSAMTHAERLTDPSARDDLHDIGGEFGMSVERMLMSNASTALLLNDASAAAMNAQAALDSYGALPNDQRPAMCIAQAHADLAHARLLLGEMDGVAEALDAVLSLPAAWRGTGIVHRVNSIRQRLLVPALGQARPLREYGEAIEDWTAKAPGQPQATHLGLPQ
ncbi:hypothetical protein [Protofrankia symbiont of Coriaria ruscifolia]|uniref:hypothetical protein n=1 Tax=Protofrankia symbiont of Coriaria ruscifolia TaxID=1306542 RepID=UPI001041373C|nr:hypothetical protein [Protofrankia symbiont of Coriaria ruscifolia]